MDVKLAKCYYHEGRLSVQTCTQCGANICKECAVKDENGRVVCVSCGNRNLKQEHKEYRKMLRENGGRFTKGIEFLAPSIIGLVILIGIALLVYFTRDQAIISMFTEPTGIIAAIALAYMTFSIPYGVIMLNDFFAPKYNTLWDKFSKNYWKVAIAVFLGWISFTIYWIRFLVKKRQT